MGFRLFASIAFSDVHKRCRQYTIFGGIKLVYTSAPADRDRHGMACGDIAVLYLQRDTALDSGDTVAACRYSSGVSSRILPQVEILLDTDTKNKMVFWGKPR